MKVSKAALQAIYRWQPSRGELNRADCLPETILSRLGLNEVSEAERGQIADHLITCPDCAQELKIVSATKSWVRQTVQPSESTNRRFPADQVEEQAVSFDIAATDIGTEAEGEVAPQWWQALIPRFFSHTGFNPFTAAVAALLLIISLSLATWLLALHFKHKAELAQLASQQFQVAQLVPSDEPATPETLQARIEEAQKQLMDVQTQLTEQNADRVLSNQELLGIQNDTLQKEMDEIAKPQLDAPIIDLDPAKIPPPADATKETLIPVTVPPTAALFTVILHKPADKSYPNYLVEVLDPKKPKPLWSGTKTPTPDPMNITMTLVRRNYPSGKYRIRLSGVDGKKKDVLETFNLEVKYLPPPKTTRKKR